MQKILDDNLPLRSFMNIAFIVDILYPLDGKAVSDYKKINMPMLYLTSCKDVYMGILFRVDLPDETKKKYASAVCWLLHNGDVVDAYYRKGAVGFGYSNMRDANTFINFISFWQKRFNRDDNIEYRETNRDEEEIMGFVYNAFNSDKRFITVNDITNMTKKVDDVKITRIGRFHILTVDGKDFVCEPDVKKRYDLLFSLAYYEWNACRNALETESAVKYIIGTLPDYARFPHQVIPLKDESCWIES